MQLGYNVMKLYLAVCVFALAAHCAIYSGTISGGSQFQQLAFNITAGFNVINIQFQVSNYSLPNLLLLAGFAPTTTNVTLADLATYSSTQNALLSQMNLLSAIGGNVQNINLAIPSNGTKIYFTIYNFDFPELTPDKYYTITLNYLTSGVMCSSCPNATALAVSNTSLKCQCSPCPSDYVGEWCQYYLQTTVAGFTRNLDIFSKKNAYFRIKIIDSSIQLTLQEITNTNAVNLYVQYEYRAGQLAGKLNCFYDSSLHPYQYLVTRLQAKIAIPAKGYNILLTFQNQGSSLASLAFVYKLASPSSVSSLTIILASCFGVFGFVVVFIVGIKIYRYLNNRPVQLVNDMVSSSVIIDGRKSFEKGEIDKFFPKLGPELFPSFLSEEQAKALNREDLECSICYDTIYKPQAVRITTCHHVFHSLCLQSWLLQTLRCAECNLMFDTKTGQPRQKKFQRRIQREMSLSKQLWDQSSQISRNKILDDKTESISQAKSFENIRIEQIQSINDNVNP